MIRNLSNRRAARKPRTRRKRILAAAGGCLILFAMAALVLGYYGNPVGRALVANRALRYAEENHPGHEYTVEWVESQPGFMNVVSLQADDSIDTHFVVTYQYGRLWQDTYDMSVSNGGNTWNRISDRLWADTKAALAEAGLTEAQVSLWHDYIMLDGVEQAVSAEGHPALTVDMPYDPANLPPVALLLDVNCDAITNETPAEAEAYLQQAREAAQTAGLDFAAYAVTMLAADGQHYTTELAF